MPPHSEVAPAAPLITTKLHGPVRRKVVERPRLVAALAGERRRLTLLRAPAGWGKSTALAAWCASAAETRRFGWLALESADDEPERFWMYVIEAVRTLEPAVGASSLVLLNAPGTSIEEHVLPALLNELAAVAQPTVLVLDDYHAIRKSEIHRQVGFFVEHLPSSLELVLASRSEPPLPLSRLRARGELLEVDTDSLRFDPAEARELLNGILALDLDAQEIAQLQERTEGWVAGLHLAGLSLRGAADRSAFIRDFAGDDRHIVDYLSGEVLTTLPQRLARFLMRTSILDRICTSLAAAVAEVDDAAQLLREIERGDLFLVPLDARREWYRYHHLFQRLLTFELSLAEPEAVPELHRRAARWNQEAGFVSEAVSHTIAAGDLTDAGELIAQHWAVVLLGAAGDRTVDSWLSALPPETVAADVRLCVARCYIDQSLGRMADVEQWLRVAESAPLPAPFRDGFTSPRSAIACVRAGFLWLSGDVTGALQAGREALEAEDPASPWRGIGVAVLGLAHAGLGEWDEGREWMEEYGRIGQQFGQHLVATSGFGSAAAFDAERGAWGSAEHLAGRSLDISFRHGINEHWVSAGAHLARGLVRERRGELQGAEEDLARAAELAVRGAGPVTTATALLHLARVQAARGDLEAGRASLDEARRAVASAPDAGIVPDRLAAAERSLGAPARAAVAGDPLSDRETEVLRLLATRLSQREIGGELYVSLNTVKTHTKSIFRKLGVSGRPEAVVRARELGLL